MIPNKQLLLSIGLIITGFSLISLSGCGRKATSILRGGEASISDGWELVWVEPRIIVSDPLFTLIMADRLDSIVTTKSVTSARPIEMTLLFGIDQEECFVSINLYYSDGRMVRPLLARKLVRGFYKMDINQGALLARRGLLSKFILKGEYCGQEISRPIL